MPVYININATHSTENVLGITKSQTIALVAASALIVALAIGGIITIPALIALVLGLLAAYGALYTYDNISNSISKALTGAFNSLYNMFGGNTTAADFVFAVIIIAAILTLAYLGYEIYENI